MQSPSLRRDTQVAGAVSRPRSILTTTVAIALAGFLGVRLLWPLHPAGSPVSPTPQAQLQQLLPQTDPLLISRASTTWGYTAVTAAKQHGEEGLGVLEAFGDEADYCLKKDPKAFASLVRLWKLDPRRFRLAIGTWNRAVLDWAQNGKLDAFIRQVNTLSPARLAIADKAPAALPLLLSDDVPQAQAILDKHGDRAWRLFMSVNFADSPASLERVAEAVASYGDLPLNVNEEFGLPAALMLVAPLTEKGSRRMPEVVQHACRTLDPGVGVALMLLNYDDVAKMLDAGTGVEQLRDAIDLLAAQPEFVQMLAAENPHILRLFCETWRGQKVGIEAFRRCGPGATIAYTCYGSDPRLSLPAVVAMGRIGWPAFEALDRFREYGPFYDLLRRPELMQNNELEPLAIDAVGNVSRYGQDKIDGYVKSRNLTGELMQDRYPPPESEKYLQWVPLYMAYRVGEKYATGLNVSNEELIWAGVDGALTLTPLKGSGKAASGAKALAKTAGREAAEVAAKSGGRATLTVAEHQFLATAERQVLSHAERTAVDVLKREGIDLARFGSEAGKLALKRLEARGEGLALGLADRTAEYGAARQAGDLAGKNLIAEGIGLEGMERYATETGRKTLYMGKPRQGAGFDGVFEDGGRILVGEAKGGGSQVKHFRGFWQGTPEYTREVAKDVLARPSASAQEKNAAKEALKALDEGRLDIEVIRTEHVQGKPLPTRVESAVSVGSNASRMTASEVKSLLLRTPGATIAFVRDGGAEGGRLAMESFINRSQAMAKRAGVELWKPGAGPLMSRVVRRKGQEMTISTLALPAAGEMGGVGEFAIAIMERRLP